MSLTTLNYLVGTGTLLVQIATAGLLFMYFWRHAALERLVARYAILLAWLLAAVSLVMSLVYSDYFGIIPCGLCWLGRVFMYPQAVILGIAEYKHDTKIAIYSIWLSAIGAVISLYQHYLQMGGSEVFQCPASGVSDCAKRYLFEYNYITLPLVGATVFIAIIVLMLYLQRADHTTAS